MGKRELAGRADSGKQARALSGVFPARFRGQDIAEQTVVRDAARIGLANLRVENWTSRRFNLSRVRSRGTRVDAAETTNELRRPEAVQTHSVWSWLAKYTQRCSPARVLAAAKFADALFIMLAVPLRVGFFLDPWMDVTHRDAWTPELVAFTVLDVAGSLLRTWSSRTALTWGLRRLLKSPAIAPEAPELSKKAIITTADSVIDGSDSTPAEPEGLTQWLSLIVYCLPWELLLLLLLGGRDVNFLHLVGLVRLISARQRMGSHLAAAAGGVPASLATGTVTNMAVLFLKGMYLCHMAASGYMLLAHWECGLTFSHCAATPPALPGCWALRDRLETGSQFRQYVRTLYWACKTVVTLGQGDLIPVTLAETGYRIFVQFFAGLWVTAILTAYSFFFTHKDANLATNISTRLAQASKFLAARKAPADLSASVTAYFQYMQRTRNGVEEELILAALPPHYRTQCSHYVRYKALGQLQIFRRRQGAFLRTLMGMLVHDVCAPGQTVIWPGEPEEMFIVGSGEVKLLDVRDACIGRLGVGAAYAEYALFERHFARHRLEAATFCELWYLPTRSFKAALGKHFSKLVYASLLLQKFGSKAKTSGCDASAGFADGDLETLQRVDSVTSMQVRARQSRLLGHGSVVMQAITAHKLRSALAATATDVKRSRRPPAWALPNSQFRERWAHAECALILFLLAEVPHHVAFQRGFGLLNDFTAFPTAGAIPADVQMADFLVALVVEMFFYVDLWLRARYFVRPRRPEQETPEIRDTVVETLEPIASAQTTERDGTAGPSMATQHADIFQLYLQEDGGVLETLALAPIPLVWDVLPKEWFSRRTVYTLRFLRALRLLRARNLRGKLHTLLVHRGVGPALRLLADVVVVCMAAAHFAGCLYFTMADMAHLAGGLPLHGVAPGSLSPFECLEAAGRFDNCTWYMYDRSTFDLDAPYLRSMLWSVVLLSTVGFGEIVAFSTRECVVGALWIFLGANMCYFTGCALSSVLAQLNVLTTIRSDRLEGINVLLMSPSMSSVSDATKRLVRSYYEAKWRLNGSAVGDLEVLTHLPPSLRRDVTAQLYATDLRQCALFMADDVGGKSDSALFLQQLALVVTCEHFLRGVTVVKEGHLASEFFVTLSGELECLLPPVALVTAKTTPKKAFSSFNISKRPTLVASVAMKLVREHTIASFQRTREPRSSTENDVASLRPKVKSRPQAMVEAPEVLSPRTPRSIRFGSVEVAFGAMRNSLAADAAPIPISILKKHDYFGEESLAEAAQVYEVSVRVVSSARVAVIRRRDFLALAARFPQQVARIRAREREQSAKETQLVLAHHANFQGPSNKKLVRWLGTCMSLYVDSSRLALAKRGTKVLDPTQPFARWWHRGIGLVLVYNFYVIVFRLAFVPYPSASTMAWLTAVDYVLDVLLFIDIYLKYSHLGYVEFGEPVLDPEAITQRYRASGRLWQDCLGMLPVYYRGDALGMTAARLPRLLRCLQLSELLEEMHTEIQERFLRGNAVLLSVFDLVKFFLIFVSTAHYVGSLYYLLGWLQLEHDVAATSWVSVDPVLAQNPDSPLVHYMRSMYWCLSTFTVDCFGDILARNFLETCFALFTCVLGWLFIGQVIGRINLLMITMDMARKQQDDRVEDFQQYAKQRALPSRLRLRATEGLAVKAQSQLELELCHTLHDLPSALRALLALEMYGHLLRPLPELTGLSLAQLEVVASALVLQIYLPGDVICEAGRVGIRLHVLKDGCAEWFSPQTGVVYGALRRGALFGEFAFFMPGTRRFASVRAVQTCQVLQLERRVWDQLWPAHVRAQVERSVLLVVKRKYQVTTRGFLNIAKNFYLKSDAPMPALGPTVRPSKPPPGPKLQLQPQPQLQPRQPSAVQSLRRMSISLGLSSSSNLLPGEKPPLQRQLSLSAAPIRFLRKRFSVSDGPAFPKQQDVGEWVDEKDGVVVADPVAEVLLTPVEPIEPGFLDASIHEDTPASVPPQGGVASQREEPAEPLARLSGATELRWKRHEKRLRAIQLFHAAWAQVQQNVSSLSAAPGATAKRGRRISICVPPSYGDAKAARTQTLVPAWRRHGQRRHSIQADPNDLQRKLQLSTADVETLEKRMRLPDSDDPAPRSMSSALLPLASVAAAASASASWWWRWRHGKGASRSKVTPGTSSRVRRSSAYRIWAEPSAHTTQFARYGRFRNVWGAVMLLVTLYYLVVIPLRIGFLDAMLNAGEHETAVVIWFVVEYLVADVACFADWELHRHHFPYLDSSGGWVRDPQRIARHYWRHGSYVVDVLAMLPFELVMLAIVLGLKAAGRAPPAATTSEWPLFFAPSGGLLNWHTFACLRLNRFLRGVHFHRLSDRVQHFLLYDARLRGLTPGLCYLVRLGLDFLLGTHWVSCLFFGLSYLAYEDGMVSWLTTPGMLVFDDSVHDLAAVRDVPLLQTYIRTYHFSIGAITTVCYGDILPMNAAETAATLAVIFVSVAIFSILSGAFFKYFDMALGRRAEYEEKVAQVGHFLRFHRFPRETWHQMQVYLALSWRESRGRRERELLRGLPPSVRQELALHVHANLRRHVALFAQCEPAFARAVVVALQHEFFVRNDVIIQRGDMERSLYIVERGLVAISAVRPLLSKGQGDGERQKSEEDEEELSVNEWVAVSKKASSRARRRRTPPRGVQKQQSKPGPPTGSLLDAMARVGSAPDINELTEREEKILKGPFDYFGERSLLFGTPRNATCMALCVSSLFVLTSERFEAILDEFPQERSKSMAAWVMTRTPAAVAPSTRADALPTAT